jgi:DAK2 domain fusion protein YloV
MGARGNSGVILSQVLRGVTDGLRDAASPDGADLANALARGSDEAWRAVARPAEGTILSVLRDSADAARKAAAGGADAVAVADAALAAGRSSLERTREANPDLSRAGVVDAGGKGIVLLLDAIHAALTGEELTEPVGPPGPVGRGPTHEESVDLLPPDQRYEVQFLLESDDDAVSALRQALDEIGDSLVVVGGGGLFNVHVHTNEPERAVEAGRAAGDVRDLGVEDLAGQVRACLAGQARAVRVAEQTTALVAVAEGDGLARAFGSLGAIVVTGGPGNNPAVGELLTAIEAAPGADVIVLPNHRNVLPAAHQAARKAAKTVRVVPTQSIPAGLSAATAFNPLTGPDANVAAMEEAAAVSRSGEVTRAERDADTPAGTVRKGEWLGLVEGKAVAIGREAVETAVEVGRRLGSEDSEVLTLIVGMDARPQEAEQLAAELQRAFPDLDVQVLHGGQPRYPFLIGIE